MLVMTADRTGMSSLTKRGRDQGGEEREWGVQERGDASEECLRKGDIGEDLNDEN